MTDLQNNYGNTGSGYRETISAFSLSEKGYKIFFIEKGKWFRENDFSKKKGKRK